MYKRVAVLVDGGFFRKRFVKLYGIPLVDPKTVAGKLYGMVMQHVGKDELYRIFYS